MVGAAETTTATLAGEYVPIVRVLQVFKSWDASSAHGAGAAPAEEIKKALGNPLPGSFPSERATPGTV